MKIPLGLHVGRLLGLLVWGLALVGVARAQRHASGFEIATDGSTRMTITMPRIQAGGSFSPSLASRRSIDPQTGLPLLTFTLAVPHDAFALRAEADVRGLDTLRSNTVKEVPIGATTVPGVVVVESGHLRGYRLVTVRYLCGRRLGSFVEYPRSATLTVRWSRSGKGVKGGTGPTEHSSVRGALEGIIDNYQLAESWRMAEPPARSLAGAGGWGMGSRSVVLLTPNDGVAAVSGADVSRISRGELTNVRVSDLRLRNRTSPVDFDVVDVDNDGLFGASDTLIFASRRNPPEEPEQYFDATTDTNAYVLSVLGEGGRAALRRTVGSGSAPQLTGFDDLVHIETEAIYFPGASYPEPRGDITTIHVTERVENEGYYWERVVYPRRSFLTFSCSPLYWNYGTTEVRVRFAGATDTSHYFRLVLNGADVGVHGFERFGDTVIVITVPSHYLINGTNQLIVEPVAPPDAPDPAQWSGRSEFYLDWIEVRGKFLPSSSGGASRLVNPAPGTKRVSIPGFRQRPEDAISSTTRTPVERARMGVLFHLSSRQFEPALRTLPSFVAEWDNGRFESSDAGIMMVEVDGTTRAIVREGRFPTFREPSGFAAATSFVRGVASGNYLIAGFAIGAGSSDLPSDLRTELAALGSTKIEAGVLFQSSWVFAARKGDASGAAEAFERIDRNVSGVSMEAFVPDDTHGNVWEGELTLDGGWGEVFFVDSRNGVDGRYHASDSLALPTNQADLLIITHAAFRQEANRLAEQRQSHDSLRVHVVDVDLVYDEFNHGVKSPTAVRRFIQYADTNWAAPAPFYVVLLGDATVDPAHRVAGTVNADYIPIYGIPASDYMFTVAPGDSTMRFHQLIGRLPANRPEEARWMVDKLITYDSYRPAQWQNRFLFISGGASQFELSVHRDEDLRLAEDYVLTPLFRGDTAMVYRTSAELALPDAQDGPWARAEMEKGALFASFSGHGASKVYDLDFGYPRQVDNTDRLFVLGTFSCTTGTFSDRDAPGRNEEWLVAPGTGAVGAIGGTSYSYVEVDAPFKATMYGAITIDGRRVLGEVFTTSKYNGMFAGLEQVWPYSPYGIRARNSLAMYTLLGDPSMKLALRNTVELGCTDIVPLSERGTEPVPGDTIVRLGVRLHNYGRLLLPGDSTVRVVASIVDRTGTEARDTVDAQRFGRALDLSFRLPLLAGAGEYTIRIAIDPDRRFAEETWRGDNDTSIVLRVRGNQPLPLEPLVYGQVRSFDDLEIRLLNPPTGGGAAILLDTTARFEAASRVSSEETGVVSIDELTTTWRVTIPQRLRSANQFWWRAVSTAGDTGVSRLFPFIGTFTVDPVSTEMYSVTGAHQIGAGTIRGLANDGSGVGPGYRDVPLEVMSIGQADFNGKRIAAVIDGNDYFTISWDGLNVLVFPPGDDRPTAYGQFAFYAQIQLGRDDIDRFLEMVDTIKPGERVIVVASGPSFFWGDSGTAIKERLRSLGATDMIDSLVDRVDSYALIGGKGIPADQVVEVRNNSTIDSINRLTHPAYASTTLRVVAREGSYVSPVAGPAREWRRLLVDGERLGQVRIRVRGIRRDGGRDTVTSTAAATDIDLRAVDPLIYPFVEVEADFPADTTTRIRSLKIDFDPTPELAVVPSTARFVPDSVLQGDPARFDASVVNLSRTGASRPQGVRLIQIGAVGEKTLDSITIPAITPLDSIRVTIPVATGGFASDGLFRLEVNPEQAPVEPYFTTNTVQRILRIGTDRSDPNIVIYADGERLMPGDFVLPTAEFEVRFFDNSSLPLDSSMVIDRVFLDYDRIDAGTPGSRWVVVGNGDHRASFFYRPQQGLEDGEHGIWARVRDASGNIDSTDFITFYVESDLRIRNVVNWPNPFPRATTFTFMLGGATRPTEGVIDIFTITGRKIKSIPLVASDLRVGFNHVDWDGRDADGDELANGVYFYRIRVTDGTRTIETIEKLAVVR